MYSNDFYTGVRDLGSPTEKSKEKDDSVTDYYSRTGESKNYYDSYDYEYQYAEQSLSDLVTQSSSSQSSAEISAQSSTSQSSPSPELENLKKKSENFEFIPFPQNI